MSEPHYTLQIDRLVLRGLDLSPGQAERLGAELEDELQALLGQGQDLGLTGGEIHHVRAPTVRLTGLSGGRQLAGDVARSLAGALAGIGRAPEGGRDV
jgi:hypothetical protein